MSKLKDLNLAPYSWRIKGKEYLCSISTTPCPLCGKQAVVTLPPPILKVQPDNTNAVCHPALGGCNQGYEGKIAYLVEGEE